MLTFGLIDEAIHAIACVQQDGDLNQWPIALLS